MDDIWIDFDAVSFEELAVKYANDVFPEWKWIQTKQTRDGGKDGTATIFNQQTKIGEIKKEAWVEAKYTKNHQRAIPLSRIASTVLIGHNKRDLVELLLIVTNSSFSENTMHEIHLVFGNRVIFVFGQELMHWMQKKCLISTISPKYKNNIFYMIGKPLIIKHNASCQSISTHSGQLILGEKYDLFITLNVSILSNTSLQFEISSHSDCITICNSKVIDARIGTNFISIPFIASQIGVITKDVSFLTLKEVNTTSLVDVRIDMEIRANPRIEIFCQSQTECCKNLLQNYNSFHNEEKGVFFNLIEGAAGHGKSHIITDFVQNIPNNEYSFIKFHYDNELKNSVLLIQLLVFIVWGRFFAENILQDDPEEIEEEIHRLQQISGYNKEYTEYLRYMIDKENSYENINALYSRKDLIPSTTNSALEKVVILDDLQFLGVQTARFLWHLLSQENLSEYKIFFILVKRSGELACNQLNEFIKTCSWQRPFIVQLSEQDVHNSLQYNELYKFPPSIFPNLCKNIFILKDFIAVAHVLKDKHPIAVLKDNRIKRLLMGQQKIPFTYGKFSDESKKIIDTVYFFKSGVDASYLYSRYTDKTIDDLIYRSIIKNSPTGYIPYHDLLWESIFGVIKYDSEHIYDYALYKLQNGCIVEYFGVLGFFPSKFDRKKEDFISLITTLHYEQKYSNIYYILHRFFSTKDQKVLLYDRYEHSLLLFYYAYALFNVGNRNGLDVFEQAFALLEKPNQSERELSLSCLILSEIANCHYWELAFDSVSQKYSTIINIFSNKTQKSKEDWMAYFTISTRYISLLFFTDRTKEADMAYFTTMKNVQDSEMEKLAMYVVTSYNEAKFIYDGSRAYANIERFMRKYINTLPIKNKFIIKSTYLFMGILLGHNSINELEEWIEWGKNQSLEYNYRITKLDLAICYALNGEYGKVEQIIFSIIDIRDFPILACGKYYNLEALVYLYKKQYGLAISSLEAQERCCSKLGESFKTKIINNKRLIKSMPSQFNVGYKSESPSVFLIDIRL